MAAKKSAGVKNPERRNGKAWKKSKDKPAKVRTGERLIRNLEIQFARDERRYANIYKAAQAKAEREEKAVRQSVSTVVDGQSIYSTAS